MKLREKQGVALIFLNESLKKKRRKLKAKHETRTFWYDYGRDIELIPAHRTIYWICIFCF